MRRREASARACTTDTEVGVRLAVRDEKEADAGGRGSQGGQSVREAMDPCR